MELIKIQDSRYDVYERLLLERDEARSDAGRIWTAYLKRFGKLITDVFKEKIACIERKKTIAYIQKMQNYGLEVDPAALQEYLETEMREYKTELSRLLRDRQSAEKSGCSTSYEAQRAKQLYRRIAKLIHPDINPETDRNDVLIDLWARTERAYGQNSVKELAEIEVLVRKVLKSLGINVVRIDIPDINEKIEALEEEIRQIKSEKPYIYEIFLDNEEEAQKKTDELTRELEEYRQYRAELDAEIEKLLKSLSSFIPDLCHVHLTYSHFDYIHHRPEKNIYQQKKTYRLRYASQYFFFILVYFLPRLSFRNSRRTSLSSFAKSSSFVVYPSGFLSVGSSSVKNAAIVLFFSCQS